jgi:hypothetical protein
MEYRNDGLIRNEKCFLGFHDPSLEYSLAINTQNKLTLNNNPIPLGYRIADTLNES